MERRLVWLAAGLLAACQTPGYDYVTRAAPNYPAALDYTDVDTGRFDGPAGAAAERAFADLIRTAELDGQPWFNVIDPDRPQGVYEGDVSVTSYRGEIWRTNERKCVEYDAPFDCERRAMVERECVKEIVDVDVRTRLIDLESNRVVFTSAKGGTNTREDCRDIAEYPDTGQPEGQVGSTLYETYAPYDAPYGMIEAAVPAAVLEFRTDIAPYMANVRATIVTQALTGEEKGDARFAAAVKATQGGQFLTACAQWDALAAAYPSAPGVQHNAGACAEARGDFALAQARYAAAAELVQAYPAANKKDAETILESLTRISRGRREDALIEQAEDSGGG